MLLHVSRYTPDKIVNTITATQMLRGSCGFMGVVNGDIVHQNVHHLADLTAKLLYFNGYLCPLSGFDAPHMDQLDALI